LAGATLAALTAAIAAVDWRRFIIPDELNALGLALGLAAAWLDSAIDPADAVVAALARAVATATIFYAFRFGYRRLRGREGMGLGDVKLASVAGAWLDWNALPLAVEMAALGALAFVLVRRLVDRRPFDVAAKLPFGAFFAPAIWVVWLFAHWRF
jgi:leader peptidase (prepilin peptidase)/N-methyltransferase